jgi:hypothetical protein
MGRSETTRFAGRLSADGNTITGDWQLLDEGSGWRPWMEITLSKQAGESPRRHRGRATLRLHHGAGIPVAGIGVCTARALVGLPRRSTEPPPADRNTQDPAPTLAERCKH